MLLFGLDVMYLVRRCGLLIPQILYSLSRGDLSVCRRVLNCFERTQSLLPWTWKKESDQNQRTDTDMIEVVCNDRLGKKIRVKCNEDDTVGDLKKLIAAQVGTRPEKIR